VKPIDAVTLGILWDRLISITNEIALSLIRTSFSTIVRENYDLACVLFDPEGRSLAQASYSVPVFIGTAPATLRHMLRRFPPESLQPGDVVITNDIEAGTGHLWDINVMRPAFRNGTLVGFTLSISHLADIGGRGLSALNISRYEEGLQIPITKLVRGGQMDEALLALIGQNVRVSEQVIGDILANVTATEVGCRNLIEFMDDYGIDDLRPLAQAIIGQSEKAMRFQIAEIPDGVYENQLYIETLEQPVKLACKVTINGDRLHVDFDGTGPQVSSAVNVPLCYTRAMASYAIKCLVLPNVPNNEGSVNPVELSAPVGCILNAVAPVPTGARNLIGHSVVPLIFGALAKAMPDRVQAEAGMTNLLNVNGQLPNGTAFATLHFSTGGLGAMAQLDGTATTPAPSNMRVTPTEIWELETGMLVECRRLRPDSGGAGEFRGGLGQELVMRNDTGHPLAVVVMGRRTDFPPLGLLGGKPGALSKFRVNGKPAHAKGRYTLAPDDVIELYNAGGGGYGPPERRSAEKIRLDLAEGYVTSEGVRRDYGFGEV
jgi:N-methylhydantoinase B